MQTQTQTVTKPYRVSFYGGGREWFTTLAAAKRATRNGKIGFIAVWTGVAWAE